MKWSNKTLDKAVHLFASIDSHTLHDDQPINRGDLTRTLRTNMLIQHMLLDILTQGVKSEWCALEKTRYTENWKAFSQQFQHTSLTNDLDVLHSTTMN